MKRITIILSAILLLLAISACVEIPVSEVTSISVNWQPEDEYLKDDEVDLSTIVLTVRYQNNKVERYTLTDSEVEIDHIEIDGEKLLLDTSQNGPHTIRFSYEGVSLSFEYTVFDQIVELGESVQDAVDAAPEDGWIRIKGGAFQGAAIDKKVTLLGAEDGTSVITSGVSYNGTSSIETAFMLDENSDGTRIEHFTVYNEKDVFRYGVFSRGVDDIKIENLTVHETVQGITNWGGSNWEILNNTFLGTQAVGGGGTAIQMGAQPYTDQKIANNNLIEGNVVYSTAYAADYSTPAISLVLNFSEEYPNDLTGFSIENNTIRDNTIIGNNTNTSTRAMGINIGVLGLDGDSSKILATTHIIKNTVVSDNTIENVYYGAVTYSTTDLTFQNNTLIDYKRGLTTRDGQENTTIVDNVFRIERDINSPYHVQDYSMELIIDDVFNSNTFGPESRTYYYYRTPDNRIWK